MSTKSGSFNNGNSWVYTYSGISITVSATYSVGVSRTTATASTARASLSATVHAVSGDESNYNLYYSKFKPTTSNSGSWTKLASNSNTHYVGTNTTLSGSYTETVGNAAGSLTGYIIIAVGQTSSSYTYYYVSYSLAYDAKTNYAVSYNANGGSGAPSSQTKYYGTTLKLSTTKPTRTGYTFSGWNTAANGSGTSYASGANYTANAAVTLYAQWTANTSYTVTYSANGGTGAPASQTGPSGSTVTLSSTKPSKAATASELVVTYDKIEEDAVIDRNSDTVTKTRTYAFDHWNTKQDDTGTSYTSGQQITLTSNLTLMAIYKETVTGSVTLPGGTLDQMTLSGWSTSQTDINILQSPYSPAASITLYAIWAPDGSGGFLRYTPSAQPEALTDGDTVRILGFKDPENDGVYTVKTYSYYEPEGWDWADPVIDINDPTELDLPLVTLTFYEDFYASGSQDAERYPLSIYGTGTYVPDMDYICAKDNRLWGCSSHTRTIYASALGDPTDFWTFDGDALDAYQVAVGTPGDFTGCMALNSSVLLFKQHVIHKILGGYPAEYTMYTYNCDGVSESNGLSLQNCDGTAVYVTEHGIGTYAGASAGTLSKELGEGGMTNAIAEYNGEKYLLHFTDKDGENKTYIYDLRYRIWLEQDYGDVLSLAHLDDKDYVLLQMRDGTNGIYLIDSGAPLDDDWEIVYRPFIETITGTYKSTSSIFEKKRYTGLTFRLELPKDSWIRAELKADDGRWYPVARMAGRADRVQDFHVRTPRTDKVQLRLTGHGPMTILAIEREYTTGSRR